MKKAIVFDLDGTLIDTPLGIVETFTEVLKLSTRYTPNPLEIRATIGLPLERAFGHLLALSPMEQPVIDAVKYYQALFKEIVLPKAKQLIFPGVIDGLTHLKSQGYLLAIATSKVYASAENLLKAANLWEYFDVVIGVNHVKQPKPHPEMGKLVLEKLNVSPEKAVMIGDTTHDIQMGNDSGMHSIAVTYGIHDFTQLQLAQPTYIVDTFDEILLSIDQLFLKFRE
jgi:phosphoglycolate phosphatase